MKWRLSRVENVPSGECPLSKRIGSSFLKCLFIIIVNGCCSVGLFKVLRVEPHKLLWENLLVEDEAAALMVGLGIVEALVVRVEAL